jgi:hypothetical protein
MRKSVLLIAAIFLGSTLFANVNQNSQEAEESGLKTEVQLSEKDPAPSGLITEPTDAIFDLLFQFPVGVGGGEYAVATDGNFIYTAAWNSANFYKYQMDGTYLESFTIAGAGNCRDLTFDGEYFYAAPNTTTIYQMDFTNQTLVGTITAPAAVRGIAYDANNDAFWVTNGWNPPIRLVSRTGTVLETLNTTAASFSGLAWENVTEGAPHLWAHTQPASNNILVQIDISTGATLQTYDVANSVTFQPGSISGGMVITDQVVPGKWAFLGTAQNDNIWALELADAAPAVAPGAPTDLSVVAGAMGALSAEISFNNPALTVGGDPLTELDAVMIHRNGELIHTLSNPVIGGTVSYTDNSVPAAGMFTYEVVGENTAGAGIPASYSLYIGPDVPAAPGNVVLVAQGENGFLTWDAPTEGLNGGYFTPDNLVYSIVRFPGSQTVATNLTATEFLDDDIPSYGSYYYEVTASNSYGDGGTAASNSALLGGELSGEFISVINMPSGNKRVVLLNAFDGGIVLDNFIDLEALEAGTPKDVLQVNDEIWVSDQIRDRVDRFDMGGGYVGTIGGGATGGLDNLRGMGIVNNEVWLSNAGTQNGAPGNAIVRISFEGEILGNFPVNGSPWEPMMYGDEVLLSFSASSGFTSRIERLDYNGSHLGSWNTPGEINFIQQISTMDNDHVLAAGFSSPAGVYEYNTQGVQIGQIPGTGSGPRGALELGNGNILWTNSGGVHIVDINTGVSNTIIPGSSQFADFVTFGTTPPVLPGDANCDGVVNVIDVLTVINYILGANPEPFCFENADVNGDGNIDVIDALGIVNLIVSSK